MSTKKRVLIVINSMELGGAQRSLISFLRCLAENEHAARYDIDVMCVKPSGVFFEELRACAHLVDAPAELLWLATPSSDPLLAAHPSFKGRIGKLRWKISNKQRLLHAALNEEQRLWVNWRDLIPQNPVVYDVAVSYLNGFPGYYVMDKVQAARKVLWIHNEYEKLHYDKAFDAPFYEACSQIITISDACRDSFLRTFPQYRDKIAVLENITVASDILARGEEGDASEFDGAENCILSLGRLTAQKQFSLAVQAAAVLKNRGVRFRWLIIGEGEDRPDLQKQIDREGLSDVFQMVGLRSNPYPYLRRCSLFVQTSLFEGKSIALEEAKIFEKPIVSTNYPTVYDNLKDGETGLIVPMEAEAVADAIQRILRDDSLRAQIRATLRAAARGNEAELNNYLHIQMGD